MNYGRTSLRRRAKQLDARGTRIRHKIGVILSKLLLIGIIVGGCAAVSFGVGAFKGILASAPDISEVDVIPTGYSTKVLAADGSETAKLVAAGSNRQYVTIDQIPEDLQHAVVAIEDERFYDHNGIDLKGIVRALVADVRTRDFSQGASTLTQQLIKNNVLNEQWANENDSNISKIEKMERQVQRKIQEQYLAIELEKKVNDKNWILENYLNSINLGSNTLGVQAAAQRYFGKDVSKLTLSECAVIAGITKNPAGYNPILHPKENAKRRKNVLDAMKKQGYISQKQYDKAMADDVYGRISEHNDVREETMNTYFVDAVIDDVFGDLVNIKGYSESEAYKAIYQGGLTIKSTQNLQIQKICDEEVADKANYDAGTKYSFYLSFQVKEKDGTIKTYTNQTMLSYYKKKNKSQNYSINFASEEECRAAIAQYEKDVLGKGDKLVENSEYIFITMQPQVAMTIMDQSTGEVQAIVGGRGEKPGDSVFNRATQALRQQGSTMKPLAAYAPAIDTGLLMPGSIIIDEPVTYGGWSPKNWDGKYIGPTTVRQGIWHSMNVLAVKTFMMVGADTAYQYLLDFGFTTIDERDKAATTALGGLTQGVSVLEQTAAYATIANGGTYYEPMFYSVVYDHDGNVLLDNSEQETHRVLKETTAFLLTDMMRDVITKGTGTKAAISGMNVAGKTGTTNDTVDLTFYGYTPYYTAGIWMGYDSQKEIINANNAHLRIWSSVMSQIHYDKGLKNKEFKKPDGLTTRSICSASGMTPSSLCNSDYYGYGVTSDYVTTDFKGSTGGGTCTMHKSYTICSETGKLAGATCPTMNVVLAVNSDGTIKGKPSKVPAGKLDINISATCDSAHASSSDDDTNSTDPGTTDPGNGQNPEDNLWNNEDFGIQ